jgi:hypothetical protein
MSGMPDHVTLARTLSGGLKHFDDGGVPFIRRDPAVLAALPEVQALVAEAVAQERERCAKVAESYWSGIPESKVGEAVCDAVFAVAAAIRKGVTP